MPNRMMLAATCLAMLSACGMRDPEPAPVLSILDGVYDASIGGACAVLDFGRRDRIDYLHDADCDGVAELQSGEVEVVDDEIRVGDAILTVTSVGASSFSGVWSQGGSAQAVQFVRRAEEP